MEDVADVNISRVRDNFSKWEDDRNPLAPLTPQERDSIIELTSASCWRSMPKGMEEEEAVGGETGGVRPETSEEEVLPDSLSGLRLGEVNLESSQQFLTWFAGVEREMSQEQDGPYRDYVNQLESHRAECHTLLAQLDDALHNLQHLSSQYTSVSNKTGALHTDCEHLLAEQTLLTNRADTIDSKLTYFREAERVSQRLSSPAFRVTSDAFIPLMAKIDECLGHVDSNPTFRESSVYSAKYRHCLGRALGMVRTYVTRSLEGATRQVVAAGEASRRVDDPAEASTGREGTPEGASRRARTSDDAAVLYYSKFRSNAPRIKLLMAELEDRVESSPEYSNLLSDCHQCYFAQRRTLMGPCVADAVAQLSGKYRRDYCALVRSGCAFLVHVCEDEHALFRQFFTAGTPELDGFLQGLCTGLYDVLRPLIIHIDHLETLSELCNILRRGMIEEHLQNNPTQLAPLTSVVNQMLEDAQERLVYRTHVYIHTDITNFRPSPGDLAYPGKLQMMENIAESLASQRKMHSRNASINSINSIRSATSEEVATITGAAEERFSRVGTSPADLHGMWYPTVRRTLMCLFKLYRCVERSIFQGVSLETLSACMQSLSVASSSINKTSSPLDAQLFEIKHLLILREQMAPFQVDACLHETSLDWSKVRNAALGLVQKRGRLFSLSSNNSLLEFIVEGTPQVTEQRLDSKRDLDNRLKKLCELLILTCTENLTSPLTTYLTKAEVILQMNNEENVKPIALKNQPFATPDKVAEVVSTCQKNIRTHLPNIQRSMQLYLANRDTEFILFKPVRANIIGSFSKLQGVLLDNYGEDERTIIACPAQEEVSVLLSSLFKS